MSVPLRVSRAWLRLIGIGPIVMLGALLPSYTYIDHWSEYAGVVTGHRGQAAAGQAEHTSHELHCHYGSSGCSEQPAPISGRVLPAAVELAEPVLAAALIDTARTEAPAGLAVSPPTDPPWRIPA